MIPTFWRNTLPPSSGSKSKPSKRVTSSQHYFTVAAVRNLKSHTFVTVFSRALYRSLFRFRWMKSMYSYPSALGYILMLSSHLRLGLPGSLFPWNFQTKMLWIFLAFPIHATLLLTISGKNFLRITHIALWMVHIFRYNNNGWNVRIIILPIT
jgi:hypothetical protein